MNMGTMTDISGHLDLTDSDVYDSIESFIKDGVSFTAYDVTKSLRKNGFWAEHNSVRDLVHDYLVTSTAYSATNEEVKPGIWARKYVPIVGQAPQVQSVVTTPTIKGGVKYSAGQSVKLHPTRRGGVSIPKQLVAAIGLKAGDSVVVTKLGNFATLMQGYATKYHSAYTVDKYGRVVVTKAVLHKAGLFDNQSVYAYVTGNSISLRDN